jgi:pyrroloquinoline quinone (PQQ) biosynthesis protein C
MTDHAYFRRLERDPVNLGALWAYFANLSTITCHAPRWLGKLLGKTDDPRFQCLVAEILHDELGSGNPEQNHSLLLRRAIDGLDAWKPQNSADPIAPGKKLFEWMEEFFEKEPFEELHLIGALILGEVVAQQMVEALAVQVRRQSQVPDQVFEWVHVHDEVEHSHVEVSETLVSLVPDSGPGLEQVLGGARWKYGNTWQWLDGMYEVAFGHPPADATSTSVAAYVQAL